ncbi:DUF1918 domain-containing protein [Frankia tisae]|uniref:DUF1918 domain-containing protein n=2 Tax=Frankia tisae TaxID=2950104 RepID=UPI0021BF24F8|nr:DUF1918 domain-containing protein [Frankia tisae]
MIRTGDVMYAKVGDRLIQKKLLGRGERHGVIIELRGDGGKPPYIVRWDDGSQAWYVPNTDLPVEVRPSRDRR